MPHSLVDAKRWLLTGWPSDQPLPSEQHAAFITHTREAGRRALWRAVLVLLLANGLFWLEDPWAFSDFPELLPILAQGRATLMAIGAVTLLAAWIRPQWDYAIGLTSSYVSMVVLCHTLGSCGGLSTPWPYFTLPFALVSIGAWAQPWVRVVGLAALGVVQCVTFVAAEPAMVDDPMARIAVGFLSFVLFLCLIFGIMADHNRVRAFIATDALNAERGLLSQRVHEQTEVVVALSRRLGTAREVERAALARDLHDDVGQTLTAAQLATRLARRRYAQDPHSIAANLALIDSSLKQMSAQTGRLLKSVRSSMVDERSLNGALDGLVRRTAEIGQFQAQYAGFDTSEECSTDASVAVWRCAQEALTNVLRHAACRTLAVELALHSEDLVLSVQDDGVGFETTQATDRLGLLGMQERAATVLGTVDITSEPGRTRIVVRIPKRATL